jgi:hypothetical protein
MVEMGLVIRDRGTNYEVEGRTLWKNFELMPHKVLMHVAHFIGLDIEQYRVPKMTHKEAVKKYLESIPLGGELIPGWVKRPSNVLGTMALYKNNTVQNLENNYLTSYYFLRLDQKEGYEVEEGL